MIAVPVASKSSTLKERDMQTPMEAKTEEDILKLKSAKFDAGPYSIRVTPFGVYLRLDPSMELFISKTRYDEITRWYVTGDLEGEIKCPGIIAL